MLPVQEAKASFIIEDRPHHPWDVRVLRMMQAA